MNEQEKSLKLAELMGWDIKVDPLGFAYFECNNGKLVPYELSRNGLAQFAAILLKFPEVMHAYVSKYQAHGNPSDILRWKRKPTQANILDEILRMNGVDDV